MYTMTPSCGFIEDGLAVYPVSINGERIALVAETDESGPPRIVLVRESAALALSEQECEQRFADLNDNITDPIEYIARVGAAMSRLGAEVTVSYEP